MSIEYLPHKNDDSDATSIDKDSTSQWIYVHGVAVVRKQKFVNWVEHTQMPVCRNDEGLNHCMSIQPAIQGNKHKTIKVWNIHTKIILMDHFDRIHTNG